MIVSMLERFFHLKENNTKVSTEILAGITTFMTMSYIIFVQPTVLSICGMDFGAVMVATCIASAIGTFMMAFLTNYPIALAPAMGHNFYFVFTVCLAMGISWQVALGANFISGVLFLILSFWGLRETIVNAVPSSLKNAIAVGIGLLIAFIGLEWSGLVVARSGTIIGLTDKIGNPAVLLSVFGIIFIAAFMALRIKGAILWGIIINTILALFLGLTRYPGKIVDVVPSMSTTFLKLDILGVFSDLKTFITVIFVLWFLDVFDSVGTLIGIGEQAGFIKDGKLPKAKQALLADAVGTCAGTLMGTSTVTSYIESASGVSAGGRTGLTNIVTGILFLLALFFYPVVKMVASPYEITKGVKLYPIIAPALIIVGSLMMTNVRKIIWDDVTESIPSFLTIIIMALSFSITEGIAFGFISYVSLKLVSGKPREIHTLIYIFAVLFLLRYIFLK
jgi:AGZA family xanthine/uracil permease-like MFS transporter